MSLLPGVQGPSGYSTGRGEWKNLCQRRRHSRFQQGISGTPAFQIVVMDTRVSSGRLVHWNGREIGVHNMSHWPVALCHVAVLPRIDSISIFAAGCDAAQRDGSMCRIVNLALLTHITYSTPILLVTCYNVAKTQEYCIGVMHVQGFNQGAIKGGGGRLTDHLPHIHFQRLYYASHLPKYVYTFL